MDQLTTRELHFKLIFIINSCTKLVRQFRQNLKHKRSSIVVDRLFCSNGSCFTSGEFEVFFLEIIKVAGERPSGQKSLAKSNHSKTKRQRKRRTLG